MRSTLHRLAYAALVAGAMGFGGTQAFAAPGAAKAVVNSCTYNECRVQCREWCLPGRVCTGYCDPVEGCVCYEL